MLDMRANTLDEIAGCSNIFKKYFIPNFWSITWGGFGDAYVLENTVLKKQVYACLLHFSWSGWEELVLQTSLKKSDAGWVGAL